MWNSQMITWVEWQNHKAQSQIGVVGLSPS